MNIDLDIEGDETLHAEFEDLEDDGTTDAVYRVVSNAEYSVPLEFGRGPIEAPEGSAIPIETDTGETIFRKSVSGHPPYPFFRPAIREAKADLDSLLRGTVGVGVESATSAQDLLRLVALGLETQMKKNANARASGRSKGTHPSHPVTDTGNLTSQIQSQRIR